MTTKHSILIIICVIAVAVFGFTSGLKQAELNQMRANPIVNGECRFEGAECPNAQAVMQDYQLQYHYDTLAVYQGNRLVGVHIDTSNEGYFHGAFIDSLIMADNL